ncbi:MAG: BamA/TamA family outer membrane protein [Burkholderiales bacterium]
MNSLVGVCQALVAVIAAAMLALSSAWAEDTPALPGIPSLADLQSAGAVIGEIRIRNDNIFDTEDPKENNILFRAANWLHIRTRPSVIERQLLFKRGEPLSVRLIEETERVLRSNHYVYDVSITPVAYHDGVVDIEVKTRDTWTLAPGVSFSRSGGTNSQSVDFKEYNFFGTGTYIGLARTSDADRTGTQFQIVNNNAFGTRASVDFANANYDDGYRRSVSLQHPFYALDTRWAAGAFALQDERIESVYSSGTLTGQYQHRQDFREVFGGWSRGLVNGWAQRYSLGLNYQADRYDTVPALVAPAQLPMDQTLTSPFVRYEIIEDDYEKARNRDQIGRPEFFAMGVRSVMQLGRSLPALGSTRQLWTYSASLSEGFELSPKAVVLANMSLSGQYGYGRGENQFYGASARYYRRQDERSLFFIGLSGDIARDPTKSDQLMLGGDNGLRGYPLRYQSGDRRLLFTMEERLYSDWYPFRLFRVGGAVFYDVGRAWGSETPATGKNQGWLHDVGVGLRILSARSAFGNTLHLDFAFPLNHDPSIKGVQFLVKTKTSF